jgi:hypothetical protein
MMTPNANGHGNAADTDPPSGNPAPRVRQRRVD